MFADPPDDAPTAGALSSVFSVYEVVREGETVVYYGEPLVDRSALQRTALPLFRDHGYDVRIEERPGEVVLAATPARDDAESSAGVPWTNVALAGLTVLTTLYAGAQWYYVDDIFSVDVLRAVPFVLAVMGVLGVHELGHYVMTRYHGVDATLPYFIPIPFSPIGTLGAVIRMKGVMPDREALFDIGVAGPLAGLVATVVVTAVGLLLPPISVPTVQTGGIAIGFGNPPLLRLIAWALDQPLSYGAGLAVNPVVFGGWVGMFVTFLNLLPAGQLDGGHVMRAVFGPIYERVAPLVPTVLFGLAAYVYVARDATNAAVVWVMWGLITSFLAFQGSARPIEENDLDTRRLAVAALTLLGGLLCFMPVPIRLVG
ncbi:membrane-associated protease RseP (regulator of RpoE activity) [Halarchaeum rubridurum]|uniref:Membrane-associated protease RseP (Regulator of RpoE activity) n=1 Tax=Halarchaeum rubridurum TaxID=489911 RepID=A0A830FY06_9EURY|nr:site-2 protease family protein [Halarchaeum rubridurum]MBP1954091.1 membrane-associated protease RseP (regulator of RpoE activity) [Halarchaeum rubridurum]GGM57213.1 site-2 protease family protein [Halarchaeum rubridurum]